MTYEEQATSRGYTPEEIAEAKETARDEEAFVPEGGWVNFLPRKKGSGSWLPRERDIGGRTR